MLTSCHSYQSSFNPRTYIRYDVLRSASTFNSGGFNPRTYIRYDTLTGSNGTKKASFNPRTYIRYDMMAVVPDDLLCVSIHVPI